MQLVVQAPGSSRPKQSRAQPTATELTSRLSTIGRSDEFLHAPALAGVHEIDSGSVRREPGPRSSSRRSAGPRIRRRETLHGSCSSRRWGFEGATSTANGESLFPGRAAAAPGRLCRMTAGRVRSDGLAWSRAANARPLGARGTLLANDLLSGRPGRSRPGRSQRPGQRGAPRRQSRHECRDLPRADSLAGNNRPRIKSARGLLRSLA